MHPRTRRNLTLLAGLILLSPLAARAQVDHENFQQLQFNLIPSGRNTAMGGAFIGLADDATAAEINPAGLLLLLRPEVSVVGRSVESSIDRLVSFSLFAPSLRGSLTQSQLAGEQPASVGTFGDKLSSLSFASFVYPRQNWALAVFSHEFFRLRDNYQLGAREILRPNEANVFVGPVEGQFEMTGQSYGVAAAVRLARVHLGATVKFMQLSMQSSIQRDTGFLVTSSAATVEQLIDDKDSKPGFSVGALFPLHPSFSIGLSARINPKFTFAETINVREEGSDAVATLVRGQSTSIRIPNQAGLGLAYRPTETVVLAADVVWTQFSRVFEDSIVTYTSLFGDSEELPNLTPDRFTLDDRFEFRGGAEWSLFLGNTRLALRGGTFVIPRRLLRWDVITNPFQTAQGSLEAEISVANDTIYNTLPEETEVGYSAGVGLVLGPVELGFAYSGSDSLTQVVVSAVVRF